MYQIKRSCEIFGLVTKYRLDSIYMKTARLLLLIWLMSSSPWLRAESVEASAESLDEPADHQLDQQAARREAHFKNIDELIALRAPGLAFNYLQRLQPAYQRQQPSDWLYWEQKRIALLKYMRKWQQLERRVSEQMEKLLSPRVATADRNWFLSQRLYAMIQLKQYSQALAEARRLLWNASSLVDSRTLASWRRMIIRIYMNQGRTEDARTAMGRYQQDYGELQNEDGLKWLQLQAELLIQLREYNDAIAILKQIDSAEAQALILLSKLKAAMVSPQDALDSAQLVLVSLNDDNERKNLYRYIALVAAQAAENTEQAIFLLEGLLADKSVQLSDSVMQIGGSRVDADLLWTLYLRKADYEANQRGLLRGDDSSWYTLASNLFQERPIVAKSIFAELSLKARQPLHRQLAMKQLVTLIESADQSLQLVNRLFTESEYIRDMAQVPAEVRYLLVDYNLSHGDVRGAAQLMADLEQPPEDQPQFDWNLRRARVLILSGSFSQGAAVLRQMLDVEQLEPGQADKYLQVLFDLQAVEQFKLSLDLFAHLQALISDPRLRREIYYWRAESYAGLKQYDKAAYLFLKSARSPDRGYDPWYHTATFRAAESLLDAGLYEDARQRFLHLLRITENAARRAVIRQRLQSIQLKEQIH